jgi:hypothetical protein
MPEKLLYGNARGGILALSTSRKDIDDDAAGVAVRVEWRDPEGQPRIDGTPAANPMNLGASDVPG